MPSCWRVAPFTGAWIEIVTAPGPIAFESVSLPSRERGLKSAADERGRAQIHVAPFTGAWIEIHYRCADACEEQSLPSRERGLKSMVVT